MRLSSWDSKPIWDEENSTLRFDLRKGPVQEEPYNTREVQNNNKKKNIPEILLVTQDEEADQWPAGAQQVEEPSARLLSEGGRVIFRNR